MPLDKGLPVPILPANDALAGIATNPANATASVAERINNSSAASTSSVSGVPDTILETTITHDMPSTKPPACAKRGCKGIEGENPLPCQSIHCQRYFHLSCYKKQFGKEEFKLLGSNQVVCKKACYKQLDSTTESSRKPGWATDGAGGLEDPKTSERILLDWLLVPGNYAMKWRGKKNDGKNKNQIAKELAEMMNDANVQVVRDAKQVMSKLQHIERQFKEAHDWTTTVTGAGLEQNDKGSFNDAVLKKCVFYFDLLEIMGDRASTQPRATSKDNLDSDFDLDSGDDEYYDVSQGDDNTTTVPPIIDTSAVNIEQGNQKTPAKKRNSAASLVSTGRKSQKHISLLPHSATEKYQDLASAKKKLAESKAARVDAITEREQITSMTFKLNELKRVRMENPELTDDVIVALYPQFANLIDKIPRSI